jgi:hypothetical protein
MLALSSKRRYDRNEDYFSLLLNLQGKREEKMKKPRSIHAITFLLCFILLLSLAVSSAQARPLYSDQGADPAVPAQPAASATRVYNAALFTASWGITPDTMISCDPDNDLLYQVQPGQVRSTHSLQASACREQAAKDAAMARSGMADLAVFGETSATAASTSSVSGSSGSCGSGYGVTGDGRNMKIYSGYSDTRYVFLQCGKKVGEYGPPTCNCNSSFRYTYSCKKPPTVYITLPCVH